jgi:aminoglycoside phosphotransferase (APT) family kinase protein
MPTSLSRPNIQKERPGHPHEYYALFERLDEVVDDLLRVEEWDVGDARLLDGDSSAVISLAGTEGTVVLKISPWNDLPSELFFYSMLQRHGLPAPQILRADFSKRTIPYAYVFEELVDGVGVGRLPSSTRYAAAAIVGETMAKIHQIPVAGFGVVSVEGTWSHADARESLGDVYVATDLAKHAAKVPEPSEIEAVHGVLDRDELRLTEPRLTHGDVAGSNFLFTIEEGGLTLRGVLDPDVVGGDPMADVAMATSDRDEFAVGFMGGYSRIRPLSYVEIRRMELLQVLALYWSVSWHTAAGWDAALPRQHLRTLLDRLGLRRPRRPRSPKRLTG